jgi:hypothetical protein
MRDRMVVLPLPDGPNNDVTVAWVVKAASRRKPEG